MDYTYYAPSDASRTTTASCYNGSALILRSRPVQQRVRLIVIIPAHALHVVVLVSRLTQPTNTDENNSVII